MSFTQINQQQVTPGFIAAVVAAIPSDSISGTQIENNTITGNNLSPANAAGLLTNDGSGNLSYVAQSALSISSSQVSGLGSAAGNNTGDFISSAAGSVTSTNIANNTITGNNLSPANAAGLLTNDGIGNLSYTSTGSFLSASTGSVSGGSSGNIASQTITGSNLVRYKDSAAGSTVISQGSNMYLTAAPYSDAHLAVYKNGLLVTISDDYNLSSSVVTFLDTVQSADLFTAMYDAA